MAQKPKPDPSEIPEFDRVMRGLVNVDPAEIGQAQEDDAMKLKRQFWGIVRSTGERVTIEDRRKVIDTTTQHDTDHRRTILGDKPYCRTTNGREVRCKDGKYVNQEQLEGDWEIHDDGEWKPLDVSSTPPA